MSITSHSFLLLFIPLIVGSYYWLTKTPRQKMFFLLAASYFFYALAGLKMIPALFGLSLVTYWAGRTNRTNIGILSNLAALILFKYWNFGIENINLLISSLHLGSTLGLLKLGLPLGLSFFTFKHIGYLLDLQQKRYSSSTDFWAFATYSAYFPQVSAGPISNFKETSSQFDKLPDRLTNDQFLSCLIYISLGLAKKILIADTIGELLASSVNQVGGFSGLIPAWYLVIAYAAQLYFDFSGYTDMALGVSALFGIRLPQNFNNPYLAANPGEFWERWHMSLSTWFRYYLFFPLSRHYLRKFGSEKREWAQYTANLITMSLIGLWHGAGWNFILWGFYHGVYLNIGAWRKQRNLTIPNFVERGFFLLAILLGWALFMGSSMDYLVHLFKQLFGFGGLGSFELVTSLVKDNSFLALIFGIPIAFSGLTEAHNLEGRIRERRLSLALLGAVAALCILLIDKAGGFIYIQF